MYVVSFVLEVSFTYMYKSVLSLILSGPYSHFAVCNIESWERVWGHGYAVVVDISLGPGNPSV